MKSWWFILLSVILLILSSYVYADYTCPTQTAACIDEGLCGGNNECSPQYVCGNENTKCAFCADGYEGIPPNCHICGNGQIEPGEDCDGELDEFAPTCQSLGYAEGVLSC